MLESKVEDYLIKKAVEHNFLCYKFTSPGNNGVPDRILIGNGRTLFVETKAPGKTARKLQKYMINQMIKHGADVRLADTFDKIDQLFQEIDS